MNTNIYLESIKSKQSKSNTEKYRVIDCQGTINEIPNTTEWIILEDVIKKTNDLKIITGILLSKYKIVVKIGKSDTIKREYQISHLLASIPNFIIYLCYFSCTNNIEKIIANSSICASEGDKLKILVMKEYSDGDIKSYNWTSTNFIILLSLLKQIITALFIGFRSFGFIHNDVHFGNFLIKQTDDKIINYTGITKIQLYGYKAIIMDFENSLFDTDKKNYEFLYQNFEQIINGIRWYLDIKTNNIEQLKDYLAIHIKNKSIIDINEILHLIDKLEFIEKIDKTKILKYNPNIY